MNFEHMEGIKPAPSSIELGRGADGVVIEVLYHSELVIKEMNHRFKLGINRVNLERRVLHQVLDATHGLGATKVWNQGTDDEGRSWLVRDRVFDVFPRGTQESRTTLVQIVLAILPNADVNLRMLPDPTFDNVRWGYTAHCQTPRWILIDP